MKKLMIVLLISMVSSLSQGAVVMEDGFEAAENLAGNGWTGSWNFSNTTYGNPANYMWSAGAQGTTTKDTGYVIQSGDELELVFDLRDMEGGEVATGEEVIGKLFYDAGAGVVELGSVAYDDGDVPAGWNNGFGALTVTATAGSVGENLQVSFEYTYGGSPMQRFGIDNVIVSVIAPLDLVPIADAGYSHVTWRDNGTLALAGTVDDRGEGDIIDTDVVWSIKTSPPGSAATLTKTSTDWANPTADFTPDLSIAGDYTIELTATDAAAQPDYDTLVVQVADDACEAAQLDPNWTGFDDYDINENCIIDLPDLTNFASKWLDEFYLPGPFSY
jgi:hypothetical protein